LPTVSRRSAFATRRPTSRSSARRSSEAGVLYMIIETFRDGDAAPVYQRFRERGRLAPDGVRYVSSWVTADMRRCFQVMECDDRALIDVWIAAWNDLVEFEVIPVVTSADADAATAPR